MAPEVNLGASRSIWRRPTLVRLQRMSKQRLVESFDGYKLFCRFVPAKGPVTHRLLLHHGLGEHSGRYETFLETLSEAGIESIAFDMRGHGQNKVGPRGDAGGWRHQKEDLKAVFEAFKALTPMVLMGQSMGGFNVLRYALEAEAMVSGLISLGNHKRSFQEMTLSSRD